jgi:Tfp pilus assembly protein PilN
MMEIEDRRSANKDLIELSINVKQLIADMADVKKDLDMVLQHDKDITGLQRDSAEYSKAITALTDAVTALTTKLGDMSLKFVAGMAWLGGASAIVALVWILLSSGLVTIGVHK